MGGARVKICGLSSGETFDAAVQAGADWVGFVFVPASPRAVTPAQAAQLSARVQGGPGRVGLFVEPADEDIAGVLHAVKLDALQIYAPRARAASLRERFGVPVWHAIGVDGRADLPDKAAGIDAMLLDAKPVAGAALPGGNAAAFDWTLVRGWQAPLPWLLAGGLHPGNVAEAIEASGAPAVDVSSGVERGRGVKDSALIRAFVEQAKGLASTKSR